MKIVFQFSGGPLDGKTVIGDFGGQDEADRYFALTNHGRIGQRFRVASQYAIDMLTQEQLKEERPHHFQEHVYRVTGRLEADEKTLVVAEYVRD
jgi:hypothetical protein